MNELNQAEVVSILEEEGFDTLKAIDLADAFSISQITEEGHFMDLIIGRSQAEQLIRKLREFLG